jgi:hypothetical protein
MRLGIISATFAVGACASAGREQPDGAGINPDAPERIDAPIDTPAYACTSNETCGGATSLGSVSGDTGSQQLSAMGTRAAWFRVRVTEDDNDIGGTPENLRVTLTSPASADFAVFIYLDPTSDVVECSQTVGTKTTNGKVDQVAAQWGETGAFANGSDDSRDVSIEIRALSGTCDPDQMWQLSVQGDP